MSYNFGGDDTVTRVMEAILSSKFQLVIPKAVRDRLGLKPGQRIIVLEKGGVIHLVPERSLAALRGMARGTVAADGELREKRDRY